MVCPAGQFEHATTLVYRGSSPCQAERVQCAVRLRVSCHNTGVLWQFTMPGRMRAVYSEIKSILSPHWRA